MSFELVEPMEKLARIKVAGIGGAGGNAINRMIEAGLGGVEFMAVNTDLQALRESRADQVLQIGGLATRGLGSGGDPMVGRQAVDEDLDTIVDSLEGSDMVFVTAGMGGGTGTGAAPVVARLAREQGALTVGIVTKPFRFEGRIRQQQAEAGLAELREAVDTLIVIPNERLLEVVPDGTSMTEAFGFADNVLYEATRGIHDIIMKPHQVNLDFADVRSVMAGMGVALMGTGKASGDDRAEAAARKAIHSPLLEDVDIAGARGVLVNLTGGEVGLRETNTVMSLVQEAAGDQAHIIFGYGTDPELGDTLQVTVIATGFDGDAQYEPVPHLRVHTARPEELAAVNRAREASAERPALTMAAAAGAESPVAAQTEPAAETSAAPVEVPAPATSPTTMRFTLAEPDPHPSLRPEPALQAGSHVREAVARQAAAPRAETVRPAEVSSRDTFMSDSLMRDLSEPAYTRKYMD
ncbi:cell division protein FtsZ [bacterium]|nr:cell division protein FtsZ [bacterium]